MGTKAKRYDDRYNEGHDGYNPHRDDGMRNLLAMSGARVAKYGSESCPKCQQVYRCDPDTHVVADHVCKPLDADKLLGM